MKILLSGPIEGHLESFYKGLSTENQKWVVCSGDLGIYPDTAVMSRAAKKHAGTDFSKMYVGALSPATVPTLTISGVHDDHRWVDQRWKYNNTEILHRVHWLANGYRTTIGWDEAIRVTGFGKAYSPRSYDQKRAWRHYTRKEVERACSSGPTDLLVIYEHLDAPGIRNIIYATRPKRIFATLHNNRKHYHEIQGIPIIQLRRHETMTVDL
jgi:hypothetical protein